MGDIELDAFLADSVASVQGKLYALGAGWNRIAVALFPARHDRVGIGLLFRVRAGSPAEPRRFELRLIGPAGEELTLGSGSEGPVNRIGGEFTAGGADEQIVPIALNLNGLALPAAGAYRVMISMQGEDVKTLPFSVQTLAAQPRHDPPPTTTGTAGYL
ncbi:MAG TPA: hypothetical protein VJP03_04000 [Actinomycetota bacterium]|nr:hypothetical protein [Actinomycetota bacterium]